MKKTNLFETISHKVTNFTGSTYAFVIAIFIILVWLVSGPIFAYSDTWQLIINTGTTIVTFLMVFLIQRAQNKESKAIHLKLNELVAALKGASNRLIDVEDISEVELEILRRHYQTLYHLAKEKQDISHSHSVEEAIENAEEKEDAEDDDCKELTRSL